MSDWENDDEPQQPVAPPKLSAAGRKKFDDEDVEDEVKDDWEEDDSEPEAPKAAVALPPRKKKSVKQKIAEKEEEERLRREAGLDGDDASDSGEWDDDPLAKRRREREAQLKSDVENAANLLGTSKLSDDSSLKNANPSSKEDWEAFSDSLFTELIKKHAAKPGFDKHFVPHFLRNIASTLRDVDIRKSSTMLKTYAEDKVKAEKEAKRLGGQKAKVAAAKPKTVGTASAKNVIDTRAYGDEALDDDLDFM
ncbi:conserved hypothetical protein [Sporisorium reilianum SRZ2]|uniref:Eukaryotic translation initiation factor 3 subunit J n=2 Tax=Sporisorium reilianum TaxID=72558 RepID=E6ZQ13_SPORE|nr:conserved hypothetical protein [Sporisorium reilianum SRZ2]SJX64959.1 uncharacterized protein SRS1_15785 [Sporisorium reilianum f. sp. reilianum]